MRIGIVGGGQLGMMMAEAAVKYGHSIVGLDPVENCPLSYVADSMIVADYNNKKAFEDLAEKSDVITYEFENVDLFLINEFLTRIPQKSMGLEVSRERLREKNFVKDLGVPTVKFNTYKSLDDVFYPSIIKTNTGGYDGKGQHRLHNQKDVDQLHLDAQKNYIIEEYLSFDYEISVIASRDKYGNVVTYPIPKNTHKNGILFISEVSKELPCEVISDATKYANSIITSLDYVGTLAVEFFVIKGKVIFNEFAPRPHNSGHYSIEGCNVSQYSNHILAICGEKVITPFLMKNAVMINVLGQNMDYLDNLIGENIHVHMYNKKDVKKNRKMGHITVLDNNNDDLKIKVLDIIKESI